MGRKSICLLMAIGLAAELTGCGGKQSEGHTYDTAADFRLEEGNCLQMFLREALTNIPLHFSMPVPVPQLPIWTRIRWRGIR